MRIAYLLPSWPAFLTEMRQRFNLHGLGRQDWLNRAKRTQLLRMIGRWHGAGAMYYATELLQGVLFDNSGTYHYRVGLPMKWLAAGGHDVRRVAELDAETLDCCDVVVIPRAQSRELAWQIAAARAAGARARIVYECDDWVFSVPPSNPARMAIDPVGSAEVARVADAITVTTKVLAGRYREAFPDKPIFVLPNSIDFDCWEGGAKSNARAAGAPKKRKGVVRIMWAGSATHDNDFQELYGALAQLRDARGLLGRRAELAILGDAPPAVTRAFCKPPLGFRLPRVNVDEYWPTFAALKPDVCLAPLNAVSEPDRSFNACKSNIKYLEAAAAGACTVATNIETYAAKPNDGTFLCGSADEWLETLEHLITDDAARRKAAKDALHCVRGHWNMAHNWRLWEEAYERIAASARGQVEPPAEDGIRGQPLFACST